MQRPPEQRTMRFIVHNRRTEERRQDIAEGAAASLALFRVGKLKRQSAKQAIQDLHEPEHMC